jgi:hypothetical protein
MKKTIIFLAIALKSIFLALGAQAQVLWSYENENTSSFPDKSTSLGILVLMVVVAATIFISGLIYKAYKRIKKKYY